MFRRVLAIVSARSLPRCGHAEWWGRRLLSFVRTSESRCGHTITQPADRRKAIATVRRAGHAYVEFVLAKKFGQGEIVEGWFPAKRRVG